jgi:hypothetical protein
MDDESPTERPTKRSTVGRDLALSLLGAGIFGALLVSYILKSVPTISSTGNGLIAADDASAPRGPDTLELAQRVAEPFVEALRVGDYDGAYAQMARPYREAATAAAFRAAWKTPLLAGPRGVKLSRARSEALQTPDGKFVAGATFTASGMITAAAGALEISFTFLREAEGPHVIAVFVGGVPIVQGLGPPMR